MHGRDSLSVMPVGASALEQIITLLPKLSQPDLRTVMVAVDKIISDRSNIDISLLGIMFNACDQKPLAIGVFGSSPNGALWRKNIVRFIELVERLTAGHTLRRASLHALHLDLFRQIVEYIRERHKNEIGPPLTLKTVCSEVANIQAIFNENFPGYLHSALGRSIYLKGLGVINGGQIGKEQSQREQTETG